MEIDDAIDAGIPLLQCDELHDRAEVIAEMQIAGRLNPGKNQLIERHRAAPSIARGPCHGTATARKRPPTLPSLGARASRPLFDRAPASAPSSNKSGRDARAPRAG